MNDSLNHRNIHVYPRIPGAPEILFRLGDLAYNRSRLPAPILIRNAITAINGILNRTYVSVM